MPDPEPNFVWVWEYRVDWWKTGRGGELATSRTAAIRDRKILPLRPKRTDGDGLLVETIRKQDGGFHPQHRHLLLRRLNGGSLGAAGVRIHLPEERSARVEITKFYQTPDDYPGKPLKCLGLEKGQLLEVSRNSRYISDYEGTWAYTYSRVRILWAEPDNAGWEKLTTGPADLEYRDIKKLR